MGRKKIDMGPARMIRLDPETEALFVKACDVFRKEMPGVSDAVVLRTLVRTGAMKFAATKEAVNG